MSVLSGLILSGATPVFCPVMQDETWLLPKPYTIEEMQKVMQAHPKAKACLVAHADYHGLCADLTATAQLCRAQQCLLLADEAHGSHFAFLPDGPVSAKEAVSYTHLDVYKRQVFRDPGEFLSEYDRVWTEVKASK